MRNPKATLQVLRFSNKLLSNQIHLTTWIVRAFYFNIFLIIVKNSLHFDAVESEDFKVGVVELANLLQVPRHPDHLMTLEGICNVIQEKLSQDALKEALKTKNPGNPVQFENISFGLDIKSPNVSSAANVLRYLFIHDLRDLQTKINECLVCVQALTANPKTDTKLGKVGF
jgi:RLL motif-containing protein 1